MPTSSNLAIDRPWDGRNAARRAWLAALLVAALSLLFALVGRQVWEDYWITYRSSRNLVAGLGLVYQSGEHVHTYTSPLGALAPALGLKLTGSDVGALWFLRILSIGALAGAALLVVRRLEAGLLAAAATIALAFFDSKTVLFATSGMETGLMVFFVALVWHELWSPRLHRILPLAVGLAGLMWTRPDGFIPALAMLGGTWVFRIRPLDSGEKRQWFRQVIAASLAGAVLYLPWLIWAWSFYGSPVPNTIVAKSVLISSGPTWSGMLLAPLQSLVAPTMLDGLFGPTFFRPQDWPTMLEIGLRLLARAATFVWLLPGLPRPARAASLAVMMGNVYLQQIPVYSWYYGPWTLLGGVALGGVWEAALRGHYLPPPVTRISAILLCLVCLGVTCATMQTARVQDRLIENAGRKAVGLWLHDHAQPNDTVFLEPLGYIGYYSNLKMLDYPGLCAPEVTRLIKAGHSSFGQLIPRLQPTWLVLRPSDIVNSHLEASGALNAYSFVRAWDQRSDLDAVGLLPGRSSVEFDAVFLLYRRR